MKWMTWNKDSFIKKRTWDENEEAEQRVREIIANVRKHGDQAVKELTKQLDGADLDNFSVSTDMIQKAYEDVSDEFVESIKKAAENIRLFHERKQSPLMGRDV